MSRDLYCIPLTATFIFQNNFMRLFEAIIDANHRAVAGDATAGLHPDEFADALPVIALTCIDPRLNAFFPNALALPEDQFIWLRNAGNIITEPLSSTMRSLALACAVKGGQEIAIIGHTDCQVARTPMALLLDKFSALGIERNRLPDNLAEFFGTFSSERQNVIKACDFARHSPLIGPKIPVHGLMIDIATGKLDWVVNGYETLLTQVPPTQPKMDFAAIGALGSFKDFDMGEMKFPELKIGAVALPGKPLALEPVPVAKPPAPPVIKSPLPPLRPAKVPLPPPLRPRGFQ